MDQSNGEEVNDFDYVVAAELTILCCGMWISSTLIIISFFFFLELGVYDEVIEKRL